ncbi:MAG: aldo/keto reductase [Ktedonobacterales bacterium]|nr:aldo/keto reductase [Ktedonobacterales bacterium]
MSNNRTIPLAPDMSMVRILNGMWQVSGGHGRIDPQRAVADMLAYHDAGFTTWDLADHYGPAEDLIGDFRRKLLAERGAAALASSLAFTKWVPMPGNITRRDVENAVHRSRRRMGVERLDLLQFHWWDYNNPAYLDALRYLADLRDAGEIRHLALTNFDTAHLRTITEAGIRVVANQVQYSLVDQRPDALLAPYGVAHDIRLLAYGTLMGGLLSERYLGQPEPLSAQLDTASLGKYKRMLDTWGDWALFQDVLRTLKAVADKHGVSIANVATRAVLDRPAVAGVIIGARLGLAEHLADTARVFSLALDDTDRAQIAAVTGQGRDLMRAIGDCGDEYRHR